MDSVAERFSRCFNLTWEVDRGWAGVRFVVIDTEMTGLDPRFDRIVSIGAIPCIGVELHVDATFEAYVRISHNTSAVRLHGITRELAEAWGAEESQVIAEFLDYLRDGIIVGHHVRHDVEMLELAAKRCWGIERLPNLVIDTADLSLRLEEVGLLCQPHEQEADYSLDGLCSRFGIPPHDRHTATGDAFLAAQVFMKLLKRARRGGMLRLGELTEPYHFGRASDGDA